MVEPYNLEENTIFTDTFLKPLIELVDQTLRISDIDRLRESLNNMRKQIGTIEAFPFQETMDKADELIFKANEFEAIINLLEARQIYINYALNRTSETPGASILKQILGG